MNKKFFIKQTDLDELIIQEREELDWKKNWINSIIKNTVTSLLLKFMELGAMSVNDFRDLIEKKIKDDQKIN